MARFLTVALRSASLFLVACALHVVLAGAGSAADLRAPGPGQTAQRRVALVIGNGAYERLPHLPNPPNDATLIATTLQDLGFVLIGGGAQLNLDKAGFDAAVQRFGAELQNADVGLFYYAGHGLQVQGTNWLVPIGANPVGAQDLDFQMVDAGLVLKQMQYAKTRLNVVILDACRNNPFAGRSIRATDGGLAEMRAPEGTLIAYATQPGNVAHDGVGANSPFSAALATTLRQPGLDVFRLFNQVGLAVKRETGGDQQPWVSSSPIDGDFYFSGVGPGGTTSSGVDGEVTFWQSIANSTDPAEYKAYLQQYPDGRFAAIARQRAESPLAPSQQALLTPAPDLVRPALPLTGLPAQLLPPPSPPPAVPMTASAGGLAPALFAASVRAINELSLRADMSYRDYAGTFNPDRGPTGKETNIHLIDLRTANPVLDGLTTILTTSPAAGSLQGGYAELNEDTGPLHLTPVDCRSPPVATAMPALARRYVTAAQGLTSILEQARTYYGQQDYRDDNFAKGRAMHPGIITAYREFHNVGDTLRNILVMLSACERDAYLAGLAPDKRAMESKVLLDVSYGRHLVQTIVAGSQGGKEIRRVDLAALKAQIDLADQSLTDLRQLFTQQPGIAERVFGPGQSGPLNQYLLTSARLLLKCKYLWRSLRDNHQIDENRFSIDSLLYEFNEMVFAANQLS